MSSKEQLMIAHCQDLANEGLITKRELDWCIGAIRNRHGLTRETRLKLRNTVLEILNKAKERALSRYPKDEESV